MMENSLNQEKMKNEMMDESNLLPLQKEKNLEEIIKEIAEEEGMTYDETLKLFKKGIRDVYGVGNNNTKKKKDNRKKNKQARKSRKRNR